MPVIVWPDTPVGPLWADVAAAGALTALHWGTPPHDATVLTDHPAIAQLTDYFAGRRTTFDISLQPQGTPFQQRVWQALAAIPHGQTRSYKDLAVTLGSHPRAIGHANGRNPLPLFIPCHRVVNAAIGMRPAALGGYSGAGGLATKQTLLSLEQNHAS